MVGRGLAEFRHFIALAGYFDGVDDFKFAQFIHFLVAVGFEFLVVALLAA